MKFLVFSPYYPPHTGGLESHSKEFNKELSKLGHHVTVFTPALPLDSPRKEMDGQICIIRYPAFEIVSNYPLPLFWKPLFWKQLFSLKEISDPDIVITRTRFFFLSFIGLLFAKKNSLPHVHIEHGSDYVKLSQSLSSFLAYLYDQVLGRIVFKYSTLTISISQAVQNFVKKFDSRHSPIIYRGLDFTELNTAEIYTPSSFTKYNDRLIITTAARLYKWKGIERSIQTIQALPNEIQEKIIFVVIGDGEDKKRLEELSFKLPVLFLGRLSRKQTIGFLKKTDIYIHSSYPGGGLSTSLLEAMYCRCAVIATPHEGANEIVQDNKNGILMMDDNFSEALLKLISHPEMRSHLATQAKESVEKKFSWDKSITSYLTYFEKL